MLLKQLAERVVVFTCRLWRAAAVVAGLLLFFGDASCLLPMKLRVLRKGVRNQDVVRGVLIEVKVLAACRLQWRAPAMGHDAVVGAVAAAMSVMMRVGRVIRTSSCNGWSRRQWSKTWS